MVITGVCSPIKNTKIKSIFGYIRSLSILIAMFVCVFYPCTLYFIQHISDMVDATGVGLMMSIGFYAAVGLISFAMKKDEILKTLRYIESAVENSKLFEF